MFQRLSVAIVQIEAVNKSEHLLNEIRPIICFLYLAKETAKKSI